MLTGNKGEWSEIYVLLKTIADRQIVAGDKDLNKLVDLMFPVVRILRDESGGSFVFSYDSDIVVVKGGAKEFRIPIAEFHSKSKYLLERIQEAKDSTFSVPLIEQFIYSFDCTSLKAKSTVKSDIRIVIHDDRVGSEQELGFSIKSQLGGASTLLNPGKTTNFAYRIIGGALQDQDVNRINAIKTRSKVKDRLTSILDEGFELRFEGVSNQVFSDNLTLIDSSLPAIMSQAVLMYYSKGLKNMVDIVGELESTNPLNYHQSSKHPFYAYKLKRLLTDIALGMTPSTVWTGELDATGGYLIVKTDGDIVCYHIYNRNEFEDYLLLNTKLDTASTSRYEFGEIYSDDLGYAIKLNLQIRFVK